ncbi:MAG: hypothetical protein OWT27_02565, partial [Firmicutes bacterium]|nr:hypothetical protein [Bacillota bacterium]
DRAAACGSPLVTLGRDVRVAREPGCGRGDLVHYFGLRNDWHGLRCALRGPHQAQNAGVALAALEVIAEVRPQLRVEPADVRRGLGGVLWPGRCEWLRASPPGGRQGAPPIILDGAHNPAGMTALVGALKEAGADRVLFVLGAMADKDIEGMLRALVPVCAEVIAVAADTPRAVTPEVLAAAMSARAPSVPVHVGGTVAAGVQRALARQHDTRYPICVAGSLAVVAEARQALAQNGDRGSGESGECDT